MNIKQKADLIVNSGQKKSEKVRLLCELAREIPYKRVGGLDPDNMVNKKKGSCTQKHIFLAKYLEKLGIPVRFLIAPLSITKIYLLNIQIQKWI